MSGEEREERRKRRERELLFFGITCIFGKIRIKKNKSKFYWKVPIANIVFTICHYFKNRVVNS
jgi:uncharacterized membrane protein